VNCPSLGDRPERGTNDGELNPGMGVEALMTLPVFGSMRSTCDPPARATQSDPLPKVTARRPDTDRAVTSRSDAHRRKTSKRSPTGRTTTSRSDAHRPETLKRSPTRARLSLFRQNATAIRIAIGEASEYASRILGRGAGGLATGGHVVNSGSTRLHGADNFLLPP
jgi:hypothetical protein